MKTCVTLAALLAAVALIPVLADDAKKDPPPAKPVKDFVKDLTDKDADVRADAADGLGKHGAAAKEAVPALIAALKDPDEDVRDAAADALGRIGLEPKT